MTETVTALSPDPTLSDDTMVNVADVVPLGSNDDDPKSDCCDEVASETTQQTGETAISRRGRGRPAGPSLKVLLTQNFPDGAAAEMLVAAGFTGDFAAALRRGDVRQLEDGRYIWIASTTPEASTVTEPRELVSSPTPLSPAPVIDTPHIQGLPEVPAPRELTDEEYLDQAEGEIRGYGRNVVQNIVAVGRKLVEVKERVGHGNYESFVRDRLGFSEDTAKRFVRSFELLKTCNLRDLKSLQIDASALYLLARPSTPDEVRAEALEKARTEGLSHADVQKLIADARAEKGRRVKEASAKETEEKLAAVKRANEASAKKASQEVAALAETIRGHELALADSRAKIAELEVAKLTLEQSMRAEIEAQYVGKVIISEEELRDQVEAMIKKSTAPLERQITALTKERDVVASELASVCRKQADAIEKTAEKATAEAKEPPLPPVDSKLYSRSIDAGQAIAHCVTEIKISPAECIAIEKEVATRLQKRPDIARESLGKMAAAIERLEPWFDKFLELYEQEMINEAPASVRGTSLLNISFRVPRNPLSLANSLFDRLSASECREIADSLYSHLGAPRPSVENPSAAADECGTMELLDIPKQLDLFRRMLSCWASQRSASRMTR